MKGASAATIILFVGLFNAASASNFLRKFGAVVKRDYAAFATLSHGFDSRRLHHEPFAKNSVEFFAQVHGAACHAPDKRSEEWCMGHAVVFVSGECPVPEAIV